MKSVTVFLVITGGHFEGDTRVQGDIRLATVQQNEAETHARTVFKREGSADIPDIVAIDRATVDHTTPEAVAQRAAERKMQPKCIVTRLAEQAAKIRAAKSVAVTTVPDVTAAMK